MTIAELISRVARREAARTEATLQADIRQILLSAPLELDEGDLAEIVLESPIGDRRRIDIEAGSCVIEVKKDLRKGNVADDALLQLTGYLAARRAATGSRYVGVLTDGAEWRCYHLTDDKPAEASRTTIAAKSPDVDGFLIWLEGVLATARDIPPTPNEIKQRLGSGSSSHALDRATLKALYDAHASLPTVRMKRQLWARLLTTALGAQFEDNDDLFVEHTLLVNSAEIIAHAVLGLQLEAIAPASLISGSKFDESGIKGVVEADFFDWVVEVPAGDVFIRTLARRLARFNWNAVEHDVLKVLYESVISASTRKRLGEYYTPEWLAGKVVDTVIREPLEERVLDPACGSGTFLFHAVRRYLAAADAASMTLSATLHGLTNHVIGMDLHPVAVTLARVTYILAIGKERLSHPERGVIHVPVYLGDSLQWQYKAPQLWSANNLVIQTDDERQLFESELLFPDELLKNPQVFDELVENLASKAANRRSGDHGNQLKGVFQRLAIPASMHETIVNTFRVMCALHDDGRNHIWGYYVRNLARPVWLARKENRVDVLLGNPPWLAYRHMTAEMQNAFREMSELRGLWHGATVATHQDLSGLFIVRAIELYLRTGGRFAMVIPNAVIDRAQFAGFRSGKYPQPEGADPVYAEFTPPWDLRRIRPHFFPRGAGVVFGTRSTKQGPMPLDVEVWSGRLTGTNAKWLEIEDTMTRVPALARPTTTNAQSPYRTRFTQGAILAPRMLFVVERQAAGPLGIPAGKVSIRSSRSANEKKPWKELPDSSGVVESEFVRPLFLGETVLPYRPLLALNAVVPIVGKDLLDGNDERIELYPGLADWWRRSEQCWIAHRSSDRLTLLEQLDYHQKLTKQFPIQLQRIVYTKSGMHLAAALIRDHRAIVNNSLYWATATSEDEALYLCAILNTACVTELVRPLMSYGKDERHFDNYIWQLPIPMYDPGDEIHLRLAQLGRQLEEEVAALPLKVDTHFTALRRQVRKYIETSAAGQKIEEIVAELLSE